jgi:predicted cobalt transporter CbtA
VFVSTLSGVTATVITEPFRAATTTLLYYDLRVRREGYDLHVLADQLGLPSSSMPAVEDDDEAAWAGVPGDGYRSSDYPIGPESVGRPGGPPYWPPPPGWTPDR